MNNFDLLDLLFSFIGGQDEEKVRREVLNLYVPRS